MCATTKELIDSVLKDYDVCNYRVEHQGQTNKEDGVLGEINFVKIIGFNKNGEKKTLDLAVKSAKQKGTLQHQSLNELYHKEIFVYDTVKHTFENFLKEKQVKQELDVTPYCYGTIFNDDNKALIFENLRTQGFQLWDIRMLPMTPKHTQLTLEVYGRWHALSAALKSQKPTIFNKLVDNYGNTFSNVLVGAKLDRVIAQEFENTKKLVIRDDKQDIFKHLQYSESDVKYALNDMFLEEAEDHVILHGDCWSGNFLFKCLGDENNPSEVRILDWQCSGLGSPVFDLSYFIYSCVDTKKYENVKDLLEIYYRSFSDQLILLGCEPEKIYSFDNLLTQWKKFSRFGLFLSCWGLRLDLTDKQTSTEEEESVLETLSLKGHHSVNDRFVQRVRNNLLHYCHNLEI